MYAFDYNRFLGLFAIAVFFYGLNACTEYGVENHDEDQSFKGYFILYPNAHQLSDSLDERITREGVRTRLSPGGHYSLFAKIDSIDVEPVLFVDSIKCCEGGCSGKHEGDDFRFDFSCMLNEPSYAILSLKDQNHNNLKATISRVLLDGEGVYSDHLSLNFIVAGAFDSTADGESIDSLAKGIAQYIQDIYNIQIDTSYISYAYEHPSVGYMFSKNPTLFVDSLYVVNSLREPWGDLEKDNAFDIVLVDRVDSTVVGYAYNYFFQGALNLEVSVVSFRGLDGSLYNSQTIKNTSAHELGHVLGLNHTTLTMKDFLDWGDYSIYEDGLDDTPYCPKYTNLYQDSLKRRGLMKMYSDDDRYSYMEYQNVEKKWDTLYVPLSECLDYFNIMYPVMGVNGIRESSPMQRAIVKKNLTLIPH